MEQVYSSEQSINTLPSEMIVEVVARTNPLEWENVSPVFPELNWVEVVRLAKISNVRELLTQAIEAGNLFLVDILLKHTKIDSGIDNGEILVSAIMHKQAEIVKLLLSDPRFDLSGEDGSALEIHHGKARYQLHSKKAIFAAVIFGAVDILRLLLSDPRIDPAADDNELLLFSVYIGNVEVVRTLLSDPRVTVTGEAIEEAHIYYNEEILDMLKLHFKPNVEE